MKLSTFKKGGIHPKSDKLTAGLPITVVPLPKVVTLPLAQHIGAPATPCVAVGESVARGQMVARSSGFVSSPVHSPITGRVKEIGTIQLPSGYPAQAITIVADDAENEADNRVRDEEIRLDGTDARRDVSENVSAERVRAIIADSGIVGLGGATFPTTVKMAPNPASPIDTLVINGCECEPYLTCDDALMRAYAARIIEGIELMLKASGASKALIGIEDNKPEAIAALREALDPKWPIEVVPLRTKYPQGGEKQLVEAVTGRRIPSGALPAAVGTIVNNVATAFAVYAAVTTGRPLTDRVITVTGDIPVRGNYLVAVGTPVSTLLENVPVDCKVILGGPMMGRAVINLDTPVTKGTSGVLVLDSKNYRPETLPCIRCSACVNACPMGLEPYLLSTYGRLRLWPDAEAHAVTDCIECGSCSYVCPSSRPLLDYIRVAKSTVMADIKARKSKK